MMTECCAQQELNENERGGSYRKPAQRRVGRIFKFCVVPAPVPAGELGEANGDAEEQLRQAGMADGDRDRQIKQDRDSTEQCLSDDGEDSCSTQFAYPATGLTPPDPESEN